MHNFNQKKSQKGLTLIELMIASALGVIVITGVTSGLMNMNLSSRVQMDNTTLQETGNTALSYISLQLRNTLSSPCERFSTVSDARRLLIHALPNTRTDNISTADLINQLGVNVNSTQSVTINGKQMTTDKITFISTADRLFTTKDVNFNSSDLTVGGQLQGKVNDTAPYAITNCKYMDVFTGTIGSANTLKFNAGLIRKSYKKSSSMIAPVLVSQIWVSNGDLHGGSALAADAGALMDNVELIRLIFSVDKDGDGLADTFVTASQVGGLPADNEIVSADIYLLTRVSQADSINITGDYKLTLPVTNQDIGQNLMQEVTFTDKIPRKVFMRSVTFRNNAITL